MSEAHLEGLNPAQRAAALAEAPQLVLAGAGSGKTETLTRRVADLILRRGEGADRILCITFTAKAAAEMRARLTARLEGAAVPRWVGTFHAVMARLLVEDGAGVPGLPPGFAILSQAEARAVVMQVSGTRDVQEGAALLEILSLMKGRLARTPHGHAFTRFEPELLAQAAALMPDYQTALTARGAVDFDDLIALPVRAMQADKDLAARWAARWSEILVDEYQDTNVAQHRLVQLLAKPHGRVFAVGDDSQSIYGWRGAEVAQIRNFNRFYPQAAEPLRLEVNYRSTRRILLAANAVAACDRQALRKTLRPAEAKAPPGPPIALAAVETADEEGLAVAARIATLRRAEPGLLWSDCAVLLRAGFVGEPILAALRQAGIPARMVAEREPDPPRDILAAQAWLRLALSAPEDASADDAFRRACAFPKRGIPGSLFARLRDHAAEQGMSLAAAVPLFPATPEERAQFESVLQLARTIARDVATRRPGAADALQLAAARAGLAEGLRDAPSGLIAAWESAFAAAAQSPNLSAYLDALALGVTSADGVQPDAVPLMTLHRAKGLEFAHVLMPGLEDGVFPHFKAEAQGALPEERRLFYVGITRAKQTLWLSWVRRRREWNARPSRFIDEIPAQLFHG
ncbi:ATP-dependent helicase [Roseomonas sp. GC11]|uniref:ATP-dependent helicase n=1 Tax=Roseomonas sp. GC11 TaxID=2950546 RepID=UPI00210BB465|nr:ATP-dependent helicase [Roseomonas sp. GC11]MCQ4160091.1 ATP-dependent helicase [Roseomonas sp. GC11]